MCVHLCMYLCVFNVVFFLLMYFVSHYVGHESEVKWWSWNHWMLCCLLCALVSEVVQSAGDGICWFHGRAICQRLHCERWNRRQGTSLRGAGRYSGTGGKVYRASDVSRACRLRLHQQSKLCAVARQRHHGDGDDCSQSGSTRIVCVAHRGWQRNPSTGGCCHGNESRSLYPALPTKARWANRLQLIN